MILDGTSNLTSWNQEYLYYGDPIVFTLVTILSIIMMVSISGNLLVLVTIAVCGGATENIPSDVRDSGIFATSLIGRKLESIGCTNLLLANLAVADIFVASIDIPFAIITLIEGTWPFSHNLCIFNAFTVGLGLMVSVHTLMWISIHKLITIIRPLSTMLTPRKIFLVIALIWGWCILYNLTPFFGWTDIIHGRGASQCGPTRPETPFQLLHMFTNAFFNLAMPMIITFYCYYHIFMQVRYHLMRLRTCSDINDQELLIREKHLSVTLFIVLSCFVLCWTPYILYSNFMIAKGNKVEILNPIAYLFGYMNSACNPIIYALRLPSFKKGNTTIFYRIRNAMNMMYMSTENEETASNQ